MLAVSVFIRRMNEWKHQKKLPTIYTNFIHFFALSFFPQNCNKIYIQIRISFSHSYEFLNFSNCSTIIKKNKKTETVWRWQSCGFSRKSVEEFKLLVHCCYQRMAIQSLRERERERADDKTVINNNLMRILAMFVECWVLSSTSHFRTWNIIEQIEPFWEPPKRVTNPSVHIRQWEGQW